MNQKPRVLFLCIANSARSQMAEAFLRHYGGDRYEVHSAGLEPNMIHPLTVQVMEEIGYPLTGYYSKGVDVYLGKVFFHYLIIVCNKAEEKCPTTWPGINQRMYWAFEDPAVFEGNEEEKLIKFRDVRDQIEIKIRDWVTEQS